MRFDDAATVDQICYEMRLADYPRSTDRARIDELFNGAPPYSAEECERNGIAINVNFLEATRLGHDARMQFAGNFLKPGRFFSARTDMGAAHKRTDRSVFVTAKLAKIMKRSLVYYETFRSKFGSNILHGIGPACWDTPDFWCPDALGVEDVLVPANTLLTMKNLPLFATYHSYTGPELIRLTRDRKAAKEAGWNLDLVDKCIKWLDDETLALSHNNWPEVWSPEKMQERVKGDGGCYASDAVPTVDCFDFYFWDDSGKEEGWNRRIVLDTWSTPEGAGGTWSMQRNPKTDWGKNQFLFTSGNRRVARTWRNLVCFTFADLSAVFPARYHSTRGLGYLIYAVSNLQNRLRCRFNETVWESTLMYLRIKSQEDVQRSLKVELQNRGFIDDNVQFIPAAERFQVNTQLVALGLQENARIVAENSSSYAQDASRMGQDRTERTKFEVMARLQMMTQLVQSAMGQAARYQQFENQEIFRRFCLKNSRDPDVSEFRAACLRHGIPEKMLIPEAWDIEPERPMGAGNKTLEMAIAEQLMMYRNLYDPEPQRQILRDVTLAITDDSARAEALVPENPNPVTDAVHDAELATASLLLGLPVQVKTGLNHIDYVNTLMRNLTLEVNRWKQRGNMAPADKIEGMQNLANHLSQHIQFVAQDKNEKPRVSQWQKQMAPLIGEIKGFMQRLQKAMQAQQQMGGNGEDAQTAAKIKGQMLQAQVKAQNQSKAHAQRTAERQVQSQMKLRQEEETHRQKLRQQEEEHRQQLKEQARESAVELANRRIEQEQERAHDEQLARQEREHAERSVEQELDHDERRMTAEEEAAEESNDEE